MKIDSKLVSTRMHNAVATADDLKAVAIAAVKNQLGLADASIVSADATLGDDGSIVVEVVEAVADGAATAPVAPQIQIPSGLGGAATA